MTAPARARALHTRAGRNEFFGRALAHPIRTILIVYAATRLLAVLAMWVAATWFQTPAGVGHLDPGVGDILRLWDAQWYRRIAVDGYPLPLPRDGDTGEITYSAWAFFPLFPMIVRGLMALGLDFAVAAVALNLVLGAVGAVLIWAISRKAVHAAPQAHRDRLALLATCLWCLYPATGILVMPYSEPLALVLTAATILLVMDRRYWWAAAVVIPLGFTRAVAPAVGIVVLVHLVARMGGDLRRLRTEFRGQWAGLITLCMAVAVSWSACAPAGRPPSMRCRRSGASGPRRARSSSGSPGRGASTASLGSPSSRAASVRMSCSSPVVTGGGCLWRCAPGPML